MSKLDVLFFNPGSTRAIDQDLTADFIAIEPPTWTLLLADSVRSNGVVPATLDVNTGRLLEKRGVEQASFWNSDLYVLQPYGLEL